MPRARDPARNRAKEIWDASGGQAKLCDIAAQLNMPESTIRAWKAKDGWDKKNVRSAPKKERSAPKKKKALSTAEIADKQVAAALEDNDELTPAQKEFCRIFIRIGNATQAYFQSHGGTYATANTEGPASLVNPRIKTELRRLREIKNAALGYFDGVDIVDLHWRIAFADITSFVEFENRKVFATDKGKPIYVTTTTIDEEGEEKTVTVPMIRHENEVRFKSNDEVDGQLIAEVSQGRDGARIKLRDGHRSMQFLEKYFEVNPFDRRKSDFDRQRLELERARLERDKDKADGDLLNGMLASLLNGGENDGA